MLRLKQFSGTQYSFRAFPQIFQGELTFGSWEEKSTTIPFADHVFTVTRYRLLQQDGGMQRDSSLADVTQPVPSIPLTGSTMAASKVGSEEEDLCTLQICQYFSLLVTYLVTRN